MRLTDLEKYGIPARVIEVWKERQGESLLPVQSSAVRKGLVGGLGSGSGSRPNSLVISAPTTSGKSFCAEMGMIKSLTARSSVIMLTPLKSLAQQQYTLLEQTYGPLGIKCLIVTSDFPENDRPFRDGKYDVAVVIYEKGDMLLTESLDRLRNIGLIVVDEVQMISEPRRGAILERLLTKVIASSYSPTLLALSAVIGDSSGWDRRLAEWLGAELVQEASRPVDLRRGVAAAGTLRSRSFNTGLDSDEPFASGEADEDAFEGLLRQIRGDNDSTIVFLKSRMETVDAAFRLARSVQWPEATVALAALADEEPSFLVRSLRQALTRGVAFHNSDLSLKQRAIVEEAFASKEIRVLFSTTTLAMGVNLAADTVYLETVKYAPGSYGERVGLVPVTKAEFDNITGRAGRLNGSDEQTLGRAIVLADTEFDREVLWENYIAPDFSDPIMSAFDSLATTDWMLNLVVSGLVCKFSVESLEAIYRKSWHAVSGCAEAIPDLQAAVLKLAEAGMVAVDETTEQMRPTDLGHTVACSGLLIIQAELWLKRIESSTPVTETDWIAFALSAPGWDLPPGMLTRFERSSGRLIKELYRESDRLIEAAGYLVDMGKGQTSLSFRQAASVKALLVLNQYRLGTPLETLEEQFQMHLGQIKVLGDTAAHFLVGLASLFSEQPHMKPALQILPGLAFSVREGLPPVLEKLFGHLSTGLVRSDFMALYGAGIEDLATLAGMSVEALRTTINNDRKTDYINKRLKTLEEEAQMQPRTITERRAFGPGPGLIEPEKIEVVGTPDKERYLIRINGFAVRLTGKSFKYFVKLAWSRLNKESGWIYKEDLEVGFNQARYLYRMKNEINASLSFSWPVLENNRLGYYRLMIDPSRIAVDTANLQKHPDFEVRQLVTQSAGPQVH